MVDRIDALTTRKTTQRDPVFTDFYNNFNIHTHSPTTCVKHATQYTQKNNV